MGNATIIKSSVKSKGDNYQKGRKGFMGLGEGGREGGRGEIVENLLSNLLIIVSRKILQHKE